MRAFDYNPDRYDRRNNSGRFNKRIKIWGPTVQTDDIGNEIESFGEICGVWAMVKTTKGSEYFAAGQTVSLNTVRFVVRYSDFLDGVFRMETSKFEIEYKGNRYDVQGNPINDDEMNKTFTIIAEGRL